MTRDERNAVGILAVTLLSGFMIGAVVLAMGVHVGGSAMKRQHAARIAECEVINTKCAASLDVADRSREFCEQRLAAVVDASGIDIEPRLKRQARSDKR